MSQKVPESDVFDNIVAVELTSYWNLHKTIAPASSDPT